jgi:hypothetical protein
MPKARTNIAYPPDPLCTVHTVVHKCLHSCTTDGVGGVYKLWRLFTVSVGMGMGNGSWGVITDLVCRDKGVRACGAWQGMTIDESGNRVWWRRWEVERCARREPSRRCDVGIVGLGMAG